jgi:hypothetical protein
MQSVRVCHMGMAQPMDDSLLQALALHLSLA